MAKRKKVHRIEEQVWYSNLTGKPTGMEFSDDELPHADSMVLLDGRLRKLDAEATFFLLLIRSHLDSVTSKAAVDRIVDSQLVNAYF